MKTAAAGRATVLGLPSVAEISVHGRELVDALVPETQELTFSVARAAAGGLDKTHAHVSRALTTNR